MQAIAMSAAYAAGADGTLETLAKITVEPHPSGHALVLEGPTKQHVWIYTTRRHVMRDYRVAVLVAAGDPACLSKGRKHVWDQTDVPGVPVNRPNPFAGLTPWRPL